MPFEKILKDLTVRARATGAIMLDLEGEVVASYARAASLEIDLIGAHHGIILDIIKDASRRSASNDVDFVSITTSSVRLAISPLKEGYYLVIAAPKSTPSGRALFESRRARVELEREMG